MPKPVLDPTYWMQREKEAKEEHHAIFVCDKPRWDRIADKHREILAKRVGKRTTVLDVGCAWGRLLTLMPIHWVGSYLGVDLCPTFIDKARELHPGRLFACGDVRRMGQPEMNWNFDVGVCISIRPMVKRELGEIVWKDYEYALRHMCKKILFLEYDDADEGSLE